MAKKTSESADEQTGFGNPAATIRKRNVYAIVLYPHTTTLRSSFACFLPCTYCTQVHQYCQQCSRTSPGSTRFSHYSR